MRTGIVRSDAVVAQGLDLEPVPRGHVRSLVPIMRSRWLKVLAVLVAATSGCSAVSMPRTEGETVVYVIQRDWHTDIALPVDNVTGPMTLLKGDFPGVRYLSFGFGERQFLVNRKTDFMTMLRALLPSQSALLMTALLGTPQQAFGDEQVVTLAVSRAGFDRILAAIWREFEHQPGGRVVRLGDGPYPGSVYYAGRDTYDASFTCNTWTAETLRAGGLPIASFGVLFAGQVMGMVRWVGTQQSAAALLPSPLPRLVENPSIARQ